MRRLSLSLLGLAFGAVVGLGAFTLGPVEFSEPSEAVAEVCWPYPLQNCPIKITRTPPVPSSYPPIRPVSFTDDKYKSCDDVWKAGKAPLAKGQPGWHEGLNPDKDGKACKEKPKGWPHPSWSKSPTPTPSKSVSQSPTAVPTTPPVPTATNATTVAPAARGQETLPVTGESGGPGWPLILAGAGLASVAIGVLVILVARRRKTDFVVE